MFDSWWIISRDFPQIVVAKIGNDLQHKTNPGTDKEQEKEIHHNVSTLQKETITYLLTERGKASSKDQKFEVNQLFIYMKRLNWLECNVKC